MSNRHSTFVAANTSTNAVALNINAEVRLAMSTELCSSSSGGAR